MKIASVADVKAHLSAYLRASAEGPVVVTRNGKAVAVLVGVSDDDELERLLLAHSPKWRAILDAADRWIDEGAGIGHDEFWERVEERALAAERMANGPPPGRKKEETDCSMKPGTAHEGLFKAVAARLRGKITLCRAMPSVVSSSRCKLATQ